MPAPIALFVYNRPEHTRRTVEALQKNTLAPESDLCIFSDGGTNVEGVRAYLKTISGFKSVSIIERSENWGLSRSIIAGVTDIVHRFGKIIVLEDDMVTSPYFLNYMNEGLDRYADEERVISIHGYLYPIAEKLPETFFLRGADCWGWATWKRGWNLFEPDGKKLIAMLEGRKLSAEFDFGNSFHYTEMLKRQIAGKNDSWAIRWYASAFLAGKLTLYPGISLVDNIGQDASGTHGNATNVYRTVVAEKTIAVKEIPIQEDAVARTLFTAYFKSLKPSIMSRILHRIRRML